GGVGWEERRQARGVALGGRVVDPVLARAVVAGGLTREPSVAPERRVEDGVALDHRPGGQPLRELIPHTWERRVVDDPTRQRRRPPGGPPPPGGCGPSRPGPGGGTAPPGPPSGEPEAPAAPPPLAAPRPR